MQQPADRRAESESIVTLACAKCRSNMVPITSGEILTFYCDNAHETTVEQLLAADSQAANANMETLIDAWHRSATALELVAREAQDKGHIKAAEVFQRHICNLEARIELLMKAVDKPHPTG